MPHDSLPRKLDLRKLVSAGSAAHGSVSLRSLPRLADLWPSEPGFAEVDITGVVDDAGNRCVLGTVTAKLRMRCQRCLEEFDQQCRADVALGLLWSDAEVANLPRHLDPLVIGVEPCDLYELVEQELLLSLPIVALHQPEDCNVDLRTAFGPRDDSDERDSSGPFSVLSKLKKT